MYVCIYQYIHTYPCFNLFILHNNSFDNQGSEINENNLFFTFRHISFTKTFFLLHIQKIYMHINITTEVFLDFSFKYISRMY